MVMNGPPADTAGRSSERTRPKLDMAAELLTRHRLDLHEPYVVADSAVADLRPARHPSDGPADRLDYVFR
jgi:hypothetical protein